MKKVVFCLIALTLGLGQIGGQVQENRPMMLVYPVEDSAVQERIEEINKIANSATITLDYIGVIAWISCNGKPFMRISVDDQEIFFWKTEKYSWCFHQESDKNIFEKIGKKKFLKETKRFLKN